MKKPLLIVGLLFLDFSSELLAGPSRVISPRKVLESVLCATLYDGIGGDRYAQMASNEYMDLHTIYLKRRKWRGSLRGWSGHNEVLANRVSSVEIKGGCTLTLWEDIDRKGPSINRFGTSTQGIEFLTNFNEKASSAYCKCETDVMEDTEDAVIVPTWQ